MIGQGLGGLAGDDGARRASIEHEARGKLGPEDPRFGDQLQHLARRPAIERRWLGRNENEVGGEERRAHQPGDAGWSINDDVIGVAGELGRFAMERVAGQANDAEQSRQAFLGALLGPIER